MASTEARGTSVPRSRRQHTPEGCPGPHDRRRRRESPTTRRGEKGGGGGRGGGRGGGLLPRHDRIGEPRKGVRASSFRGSLESMVSRANRGRLRLVEPGEPEQASSQGAVPAAAPSS